jgi:hypothetical protein
MAEGKLDDNGAALEGAASSDAAFSSAFQEFAKKQDEKLKGEVTRTEADPVLETPAAGAEGAKTVDEKPAAEGEAAAAEAAAAAKAEAEGKEKARVDLSKIFSDRSNLTPEQRAALDAAQTDLHRLYSDDGRVPNLQREKARLETQLAALSGHNKPRAEKPAAFSATAEGKKLVEDLPETKALVERIDKVTADQAARDEADRVREANAAFGTAHPDFLEHKKGFNAWIKTQTADLQGIATRNAKGIVDAEAAIKLVSLYKIDKGIGTQTAGEAAALAEKPVPSNTTVSERRKAQLAAAQKNPDPKISVDPANAGSGYSSAFQSFAAKADARNKRRA